jgi:hypothetical protein
MRGVARYSATAVPNRENGAIARFLMGRTLEALVCIAKHWCFSL